VPHSWGETTFEELSKRGVKGEFTSIKNTLHELKKNELLELEKWLSETLPPLDSDLPNKL
jgi:predicted HAD superfamily phosphohydrolase YqeG